MGIANPAIPLSPEQIAKNLADIAPAMLAEEAYAEASRCLFCYDAPCTRACPTSINVPEFIKRIAARNIVGAATTILDANLMGASCARACPTEVLCEGACVYNHEKAPPIQIGRLQRFATDPVVLSGKMVLSMAPPNGKKVAVVGSGPGGLAAAGELRRLGYAVTVYEAKDQPGGLNTFGIAPYKLTNADALAEAEYVRKMGVEFVLNTRVGKDISIDKVNDDYAAVVIAIGLGATAPLGITGESIDGVVGATEFIEQVRRDPAKVTVGKRVVVVGAGNTAIDAATEAKRLGADQVTILYRRSEKEKPCYEYEYMLAKKDGVVFQWLTAPVQVQAQRGAVSGLKCVKMKLGKPDASGRPAPEPIAGSEFNFACDMVIKSTGQQKLIELYRQVKGLVERGGKVQVNESMQTGNPKWFAVGDCVSGGKEVVNAAADGKRAAYGIHRMLFGDAAVPVRKPGPRLEKPAPHPPMPF
ncbi:MAG: NAD(P)-dependent oxidoreductase [Planctomycetes bacterium]|nr:NAD(P)-dependent oxidoreductase [Planctomycetota bacterium]